MEMPGQGVAGNILSAPSFSMADYSMLLEGADRRPTPKAKTKPSLAATTPSSGAVCDALEVSLIATNY